MTVTKPSTSVIDVRIVQLVPVLIVPLAVSVIVRVLASATVFTTYVPSVAAPAVASNTIISPTE